jgi:hypothetical protein
MNKAETYLHLSRHIASKGVCTRSTCQLATDIYGAPEKCEDVQQDLDLLQRQGQIYVFDYPLPGTHTRPGLQPGVYRYLAASSHLAVFFQCTAAAQASANDVLHMPARLRHSKLSKNAKLVYMDLVAAAGAGPCNRPPNRYVVDHVVDSIEEAVNALAELYAHGWIYCINQPPALEYGATIGLWEQMYWSATNGQDRDLWRLKEIVKRHTVFPSMQGLRHHLEIKKGA